MSNTITKNPLAFLDQELDAMKAQGTYRPLRVLENEPAAKCDFDGKVVINLSSNNYLGFATHPKLRNAALKAVEKYGAGSGAVRTISGTMRMHMDLEKKIAKFKHTEAALIFQSGFTSNAGAVSSILGKEDVILSDELNHASIIDGSRLSKAAIKVFPHKDMVALEKLLKENQGARRILVITDGVFSMDGDVANLPELVEISEKYGAIIMVDDAHSSGVLGKNGRGTVDHFNLHGRVHIQVGTLSKALGCLGGYVAGPQSLIDFLVRRARPFLFSTSHPPAVTAAADAAFDLLLEEPQIIEKLHENAATLKAGLKRLGFNTGFDNELTPITPVIVGEGALAMKFSDRLFEEGVFACGIGFPTVAHEKSRVRTQVMATHTREDLDFALQVFEKVGKELGIIE
ncbi:MAG TPA: glycine C-acetyltransferase [Chroococcales cyanobacterium]|jgi:glycine C-acetyltransferase